MISLDTNRYTFDLAKARTLAQFAKRAYEPAAGASLVGNWRVMVHDPDTDCYAFIEDVGNALVISFQGTHTVEQWITDGKFLMRPLAENGPDAALKLHDGFLDGVDGLLPKITGVLLPDGAIKATLKPIIICGHSLGGGLSIPAAFFLQKENFPVQAVYTYGGPRVGNAAFREDYNWLLGHKTFRVVNQQDIVPRVPGVLMGYRHVGQEYFIPSNGPRMEFNPKFWVLAVSDTCGIFQDAVKHHHLSLLADHKMDAYIAALNQSTYLS